MGSLSSTVPTAMQWTVIITACLAVAVHSDSLDSKWTEFKSSFSKEYTSKEEELVHFDTWKSNLAMVEKHNEKAEEGIHGYKMSLNEFSDLSEEEFEKRMLGYVDMGGSEEFEYFQDRETPTALDYREEGLVTPVKSQGHCGSCWAFSATGGIEGVWAKEVGDLISVSEQQLIDCGKGGCGGGNMGPAWTTAEEGIMSEDDYPYEHADMDCRYDPNLAVASVTGHKSVSHDEGQLEKALAQVGYPISIAVRASKTFQHYGGGVYDDGDCVDDGNLNHAILLVGYNRTDPDNSYWVAKNSWGHKWGEEGYIHMKMGQNTCGLAKRPVYPVIEILKK